MGFFRITSSVVGLLLASSLSYAAQIHVAFGHNKPPYVIEDQNTGIEVETIRAALKSQGHTLVPHYFSQKNMEEVLHKRVDAVAIPINGNDIFLSETFTTYSNCIVIRDSSGITLNSLDDILGHRITAWPGAHKYIQGEYQNLFSPANRKKHSPDYQELVDQRAQNEMFWLYRTDVLIIDPKVFNWFRKELSNTIDTSDKVSMHYLFPDKNHVRASFKNKDLRDQFNAGLAKLKASGEYQAIIDRFTQPSAFEQAATRQTSSKSQPTSVETFDRSEEMPRD